MLLERGAELGLLTEILQDVATSGGKVVLIRGEAGIGKSSLVRAFLASVEESAHVYTGYCDDLETPQPFGPLWDVGRDDRDLMEALRANDRQEVMRTLLDALTRPLRPNVLVIEDTHWSDEATLDAIKYVGRRISRTNGLLVLTYRDEEVDYDDPLRGVLGSLPSEDVERIELTGLSREAVAQIVAESELDPDVVMGLTHGNPFFVTEMTLTSGGDVPASVRDSVLARARRLTPASQRMLRHMSVIPERTSRAEISALLGTVDEQLAECERLGLLDLGDETVAFRHELIRRAVETSLTTTESRAIHSSLLDLLPADTSPSRLVHHARGADDLDRVVELAPKAASAASAVGGYREASAHYHTLAPHLDRLKDLERARILVDWAEVEYYLARREAVDLLEEAIGIYRSDGPTHELARALAMAVAVNETHALTSVAESYALEAIETLESGGLEFELAEAYSRYADLLLHKGEGVKADGYLEKALTVGETAGNELAVIRALIVKGMLAYVRGQPGGRDLVEEARRRAEEGGHHYEEVTALRSLAYSGQEQDDLDLQQDIAQRARAAAVRYELSFLEVEANSIYADALLRRGRWAEAEDLASENIGSHANADVHLLRVLGTLRTRRGRLGGLESLQAAWALAERSGEIDYLLHVSSALAEATWLGLEPGVEPGQLRPLVKTGVDFEFPWLAGALAAWLHLLGWLESEPERIPKPHADLIAGNWQDAAAHWESKSMPYEHAIALSTGDRAARLRSLESLELLGAEATARRVRSDLQRDGISVPRGKGRATREHAAGLTARQAEVLELIAGGLSNPEIADRLFLSPRTVENHVSAVMAKLDASTRAEAVANAESRGLIPTP